MSFQSTLDQYEGFLIIQYRIKPRMKAMVRLLVAQALCDNLAVDLRTAFNLDSAIGAQLDILGRIVGVPRKVYGLDLSHTFFELLRYNDTSGTIGFARYNDSAVSSSLFLRYNTDAVYVMNDFELRSLIQLKIIQNTKYSSLKNILDALYADFGTSISLTDHKDMTMEYEADLAYENVIQVAQYLDVLPRPMGVSLSVDISSYSSSSCSSSSSSRSSSSSSRSSSSSSSSCRSSSSCSSSSSSLSSSSSSSSA